MKQEVENGFQGGSTTNVKKTDNKSRRLFSENRSTNARSTWGEDERSQVQIDKLPNPPEVTDDMDIGGDANLDASNASSGNTVVVVEET